MNLLIEVFVLWISITICILIAAETSLFSKNGTTNLAAISSRIPVVLARNDDSDSGWKVSTLILVVVVVILLVVMYCVCRSKGCVISSGMQAVKNRSARPTYVVHNRNKINSRFAVIGDQSNLMIDGNRFGVNSHPRNSAIGTENYNSVIYRTSNKPFSDPEEDEDGATGQPASHHLLTASSEHKNDCIAKEKSELNNHMDIHGKHILVGTGNRMIICDDSTAMSDENSEEETSESAPFLAPIKDCFPVMKRL